MKLIALILTLLLAACGGGGSPIAPLPANNLSLPINANQVPINLFNKTGVIAPYSGLESTVIVENGLVRVWYTAEDYLNPSYAVGQANYGTTNYPFTNYRISYMEATIGDFATAVEAGTAINWTNKGDCVHQLVHSQVYESNGVYNLIGWNMQTHTLDWWTSPTGNAGSWSLGSTNIVNLGLELGNTSFYFDGTNWNLYLEYHSNNMWLVSYWQGASLTTLSRLDSSSSPAMGGGSLSASAGQVIPFNGRFVSFSHTAYVPYTQTPTDISFWSSNNQASGWALNSWVLRLQDIGYFNGDKSLPFNDDSQIADPTVFEINGKTYMMYETILTERADIPSLSVAWWNAPLATVISGYQ